MKDKLIQDYMKLREEEKAREEQQAKEKRGKSEEVQDIIRNCDIIKHRGKKTLHAVEYQYNLDKMVARKY